MRRVRVRRRLTIRGRRSRRIRRTTVVTSGGRRPWVRLRRTHSACTTCMATCGSGWRIAGMTTTAERRRTERRGRAVETVVVVCCAAVRGPAIRGTSVRPSAPGNPPGLGTTTLVFACRGRLIEVKSFDSSLSLLLGDREAKPGRSPGLRRARFPGDRGTPASWAGSASRHDHPLASCRPDGDPGRDRQVGMTTGSGMRVRYLAAEAVFAFPNRRPAHGQPAGVERAWLCYDGSRATRRPMSPPLLPRKRTARLWGARRGHP